MNPAFDYISLSGQIIPIKSGSFLFTPELCGAMGIDGTALQASYPEMPLIYMPLSTRAFNCLRFGGVNTVGDVNARTDRELLAFRNFGEGCLAEICRVFPDRARVREAAREETPQRKETPQRYLEIARMRGDGYSVFEIARQYGITDRRVYQILKLCRDGETESAD